MGRKVVHMRVKDETLLGCLDLLEISGIDVSKRPLSTCVSHSLDACIESLRKQGIIPTYPDDSNYDLMVSKRLDVPMPQIQMNAKEVLTELQSEQMESVRAGQSDAVSALRREINSRVEKLGKPDITVDAEHLENEEYDEAAETAEDKVPIDLEKVKRIPFDELKDEVPTNKIIQLGLQNLERRELIVAIEIAFAHLDPKDWGGDVAYKLVKDVMKKIGGRI